ncbi:cobyrinate a,c-diamide synthase [Tardisphaera miroshnichenkoae]
MKRLIISSDRSGSGKTIVASGIMRALSKRMKVAPFKVGPDFIDTGYHALAAGEPSSNLDLWLMGEKEVLGALSRYSAGHGISVIEGVMGLYDGIGLSYNTHELSKVTKTPIVLVIDCSNVSSTASAIVKGLKDFRNAPVKGVIFNMIGSERHFEYCREGLQELGVKALGYVPYSEELKIPSRHLGLVTVDDERKAESAVSTASQLIEDHVDLDSLVGIAGQADELSPEVEQGPEERQDKKVAAVAYDPAFTFYYRDNLELIRSRYQMKFFSPLKNEKVDDADLIYIGGGYPELHLRELEASKETMNWIKRASEEGKKVLGECGGLMYLSREIVGDRSYSMVGLFDISMAAKERLVMHYTELEAVKRSMLANAGDVLKGHEFHYSRVLDVREISFAFKTRRGDGIRDGFDGAVIHNSLGTYSHFYFRALPHAYL